MSTSVFINGKSLAMEIDTGAWISVISEETFRLIWSETDRCSITAISSSTPVDVHWGSADCKVAVEHTSQTKQLPLLVVKGKGPGLLGRDWLRKLKLDWSCIHRLKGRNSC